MKNSCTIFSYSNKFFFPFNIFYNFFCHIKDSSAKYYHDNKKRTPKELVNDIKVFRKKKKKVPIC